MTHANKGDIVKVHYTGKLENGSVFGTTPEDNPLEFRACFKGVDVTPLVEKHLALCQ